MPSLFERTAPWVVIIEPHRQQCDAALNRSINNSMKEDRIQPGCLDSTPHRQRTTSMDNCYYIALNRSNNNSAKEDRNQPGCLDSTPHCRRTLTLDEDVPFCHPFFVEPARMHRRTTVNARCQNSRQRYLPTGPLEMPASLQQLQRLILGLPPLPAMNWRTSPVGYGRWSRT